MPDRADAFYGNAGAPLRTGHQRVEHPADLARALAEVVARGDHGTVLPVVAGVAQGCDQIAIPGQPGGQVVVPHLGAARAVRNQHKPLERCLPSRCARRHHGLPGAHGQGAGGCGRGVEQRDADGRFTRDSERAVTRMLRAGLAGEAQQGGGGKGLEQCLHHGVASFKGHYGSGLTAL